MGTQTDNRLRLFTPGGGKRLKIEDNATNPTYITTVWGFGYKWGF